MLEYIDAAISMKKAVTKIIINIPFTLFDNTIFSLVDFDKLSLYFKTAIPITNILYTNYNNDYTKLYEELIVDPSSKQVQVTFKFN